MPSQIDPSHFADGQPVSKAEFRTALSSAKAELEHGGFLLAAATSKVERKVSDKLDEWLSVKDFGARGDGATNDTVAIQAAFDYAVRNRRKVLLPSGRYRITDTLWATPHGSSFLSAHISGAGHGFWEGSYQTLIDATALRDRPALVFYNCRSSYLADLQIVGGGFEVESVPIADLAYDRSWVTNGFRDSRHSPHCAIAVDAGCGPTPPDGGYPNMSYGGPLAGSHDILFERVLIRCFVVGVAVGINTIQNCDGITFLQCGIFNTKVAISTAHSQARAINYFAGDIGYCRTCADGMEYGQQQGAAVNFYGTQIGQAHEVFAFAQGFSPISLFSVRAESLHRLGIVDGSTSRYPTTLIGCDLHLLNGTFGPAPGAIYHGDNTLTMIGGSLSYDAPDHSSLPIVASSIDLQNVQLNVRDCRRLAIRQMGRVSTCLTNCAATDPANHVELGRASRYQALPGRLRLTEGESIVATPTAVYKVLFGSSVPYVAVPISNYSQNASQIAFDAGDPAAFLTGDTLYWQMRVPYPGGPRTGIPLPSLEVISIVGTRVTCRKLFRSELYEGNMDNYAFILVHEWAPGVPLTGDLASGSPVIVNCANAAAVLEPGDFLKVVTGLAPATRVLSVNGTSVTLNRPATETVAGAALAWGQLVPL